MLALLFMTIPYTDTLEVHCDTIEVNTVVDCRCEEPKIVLHQLIFRDLSEVRDWRSIERTGYPSYDWERKCWRATWIENGRVVDVKSPVMIESVTEWDRELESREWLPENQRHRVNR